MAERTDQDRTLVPQVVQRLLRHAAADPGSEYINLNCRIDSARRWDVCVRDRFRDGVA